VEKSGFYSLESRVYDKWYTRIQGQPYDFNMSPYECPQSRQSRLGPVGGGLKRGTGDTTRLNRLVLRPRS
jgi:hypothetical protein